MSSKLSSTNQYLRDPAVRKRAVLKNVATSSAIEGIRAPFKRDAHTGAFSLKISPSPKKR
jgi:hypothetical protein